MIEGAAEADKKFKAIIHLMDGRAMTSALRAGGLIIKRSAVSNAPVGTVPHRSKKGDLLSPGFTRKSVVVRTFKKKIPGVRLVAIGVRDLAFYAATFIEFGWRPGKRSVGVKKAGRRKSLNDADYSKLGDSRKKIPGKKWLTISYQKNKKSSVKAFAQKMRQEIDKVAK